MARFLSKTRNIALLFFIFSSLWVIRLIIYHETSFLTTGIQQIHLEILGKIYNPGPEDSVAKAIKSWTNGRQPSLKQKCIIPTLNPFHPDILEFTKDEPSEKNCSFRMYSEVNDKGKLYIKPNMVKEVEKAQFGYIIRINKNKEKISELQTFFIQKKQGTCFFLYIITLVRL